MGAISSHPTKILMGGLKQKEVTFVNFDVFYCRLFLLASSRCVSFEIFSPFP